ncbi:hypothetical protein C0Q70_01771 [Pomacea canaliculata]|uniref:TIR domain-containing protein n=1 Tax=Pomacea canaliculata TaxID=400727 RepID=A0A2T7Q0E8_POMCA|nr:hypothetical protein C0Q70_01771 [Pomacea canaliculata]
MYEWFHHRSPQEKQFRHYTYDVFVSYAVEDRKWVMQELLPVVEGRWNFRACVHERDFVPGKHIVDNIADCVHDSRKILMVFSPDYARSEWCQFELKYCQCCVMDRDEVLVLVLLHETESRDMTSAMFVVMKTTTYIEWANTVDARDSFWSRMALALNKTLSSEAACIGKEVGAEENTDDARGGKPRDNFYASFLLFNSPSPKRKYTLIGGAPLCRCDFNFTLDCSSNFGNVTYVPKVTEFQNAWLIDLYNNGLEYIHPQAFEGLKSLRTLLIGGNNFGYKDLAPVFGVPTLENLEMLCDNLGPVPEGVFRNVSMKGLRYLKFGFSDINALDLHEIQPLRHLKNFTLWSSKLYNLTTASLPYLKHLDFRQNRLFDFPKTCGSESGNQSLFPSLDSLGLDFNMIEVISGPICLPKLKHLSIQFNRISIFETNMFSTQRFPSLDDLQLTQMEIKVKEIREFAFNNSVVTHIWFSRNGVDMSSPSVHEKAFGGCSQVRLLYWDYNNFGLAGDARYHALFEPLEKSMKTLFLGYNQIKSITPNTFARLKHLTKLYLYGNDFTFIRDGTFDQIKYLQVLSMNKNRLSVVSQNAFGNKTRSRLKTIDLSDNPYICSCELAWFQQWFISNPKQFGDYNHAGYQCSNMVNTSLYTFYINEQACLIGHDAAAFTMATIIIVFFVLTLIAVFFRFRWHLRLYMYEWFHHRSSQGRQLRDFTYDIFVGYAAEDKKWVMQELLPVVEGQWNLRACVHERDFVPGKHIVDNIADCVQDSRKILMVFSPDYARSEWCQFELKYCQCSVMDRDEVLVLVLLHEMESRDMTSAMFAVLQTTTYIEWANGDDACNSFWNRLGLALNDAIRDRNSF